MSGIKIVSNFYSYPERAVRILRIYTPDAYDRYPEQSFPVLYMLDGQNVFNHPASVLYDTWCANTTMDRLVFEGKVRPWIIVAVDHQSDRFAEYSPWKNEATGTEGHGWLFAEFLIHHLKPFIDKTYRTLTEAHWTAIMGSSMGGLISLVLGKAHPEIFGRVGALSPAVMWADGEIFKLWDRPTGRWCKIYMDVGSEEKYWFNDIFLDYVWETSRFFNHLKYIGVKDHELLYVVERGHSHNERAWQARLPHLLPWILQEPQGI